MRNAVLGDELFIIFRVQESHTGEKASWKLLYSISSPAYVAVTKEKWAALAAEMFYENLNFLPVKNRDGGDRCYKKVPFETNTHLTWINDV